MATENDEVDDLGHMLRGMTTEERFSSQAHAQFMLNFNNFRKPIMSYHSQRSSDHDFPPYPDEYLVYGTLTPPPLNRPMCANYDPEMLVFCPKEGAHICGGCQMVKYCSRQCQRAHWSAHKLDCKSPLRSDTWEPEWVTQKRTPVFMNTQRCVPFGHSISLIGNFPAIDILNLQNNEGKEYNDDLSLAFIASGDLRNVIRTVNELPNDYKGVLKIVLNDFNPLIVMRNTFILYVLAMLKDENEAAEHALHTWYSAFLPLGHSVRVLAPVMPAISKLRNDESIPLTETSTIRVNISANTISFLMQALRLTPMDTDRARESLHQVMMADEREDYRHRYYTRLKPSHRLAHERWIKTGVFMPFGAVTSHLTWPNRWIFLPNGKIAMNDSTAPFRGWDLEAAFKAGKAHGTTSKDMIGCMYFYVKDQLAEFSRRIRTFTIQFHVFDKNALDLPALLETRSLTRFDRIEVSNVIDHNYEGLHPVIKAYGPLLNSDNAHSAIIGLFRNWTGVVKDGDVNGVPPIMRARLIKKYTDRFPLKKRHIKSLEKTPHSPEAFAMSNSLESLYNNLPGFERYLKAVKEEQVLKEAKLERRKVNRIVPHRCFARLGARPDALPDLESDERWYYCNVLSGMTNFERYVEWTRK